MDLIHYSFMPYFICRSIHIWFTFIKFILCKLCWGYRDLLTSRFSMFYIEAIELILRCVIDVCTIHFKLLLYILEFCCSVILRVGFMYTFICRKPAEMRTNNQGLTNLHGSVIFHIQCWLVLFLDLSKSQASSFNE